MSRDSIPDLLVLHAVRILGFAGPAAVARRFGLEPALAEELLGDAEAYGWASRTSFAGLDGWSLTARGRAENERQLAAELAATGAQARFRDHYRAFLPLNARLQKACTDWQLRPVAGDRLATNDHRDARWDAAVLDDLDACDRGLAPIGAGLADVLSRFRGYSARFGSALDRARAGEPGWVDGTEVDSCHRVWFELHEDLVATLGVDRRAEV
ncbi:MAG: transcriptional regulator [Hamadaea sp.]|nr:transcriptional regulator [Hamadaea sp.]